MRNAGFEEFCNSRIYEEAKFFIEWQSCCLGVKIERCDASLLSACDDGFDDGKSDALAAPLFDNRDSTDLAAVSEAGGADRFAVGAFLGEKMGMLGIEAIDLQCLGNTLAYDEYFAANGDQTIAVVIVMP